MNTSECEMSLPSDILSQDEQALILHEIGDIADVNGMANIFNEPEATTLNDESEYTVEQDYKDNSQFMPIMDQAIISNILSNEEYPGPYKFEIGISPDGKKLPWMHSTLLNKIYLDMNTSFSVDFKIKNRPLNVFLYIRATPIYSLPQHSQDFVYRCINHEHSMDKSNLDVQENVRQHIIRCANSSAIYLGDKNKNERLSVRMPLSVPQTGTDSVKELFQFVCKSVCPIPGMNRRPIEVIFTLEDFPGNILGRQTLNVRICSCPKRDKEKEEKEYLERAPAPRGKKRKVEKSEKKVPVNGDIDCKEYKLTLNIVGKHNVQHVLKYCHDLMAGEIVKRTNNGVGTPYKNCLSRINALMNKPLE